jgi:hypothetical protein
MAVKTVPEQKIFQCDSCSFEHKGKGGVTDGLPPSWTRLTIKRHAYDFQGAACADASVTRLLCVRCSEVAYHAMNLATEQFKKQEKT